jgi:hypothetical protein
LVYSPVCQDCVFLHARTPVRVCWLLNQNAFSPATEPLAESRMYCGDSVELFRTLFEVIANCLMVNIPPCICLPSKSAYKYRQLRNVSLCFKVRHDHDMQPYDYSPLLESRERPLHLLSGAHRGHRGTLCITLDHSQFAPPLPSNTLATAV